jgi:LuxR family maltose regulon positive regulatory protein
LIAHLNEAYSHKLTLLSTPAGFGKTTLLAEWVRQRGAPVAWLSLDERDNEPTRFWAYVIAALQLLQAGLGKDTLTCLQSPQRPALEATLTFFINEIAAHPPADNPYLLVLDDYHLIEAPAVHEGLSFLLEHLPDNLHLVIATRTEPPLPLARLRLRDELLELRAEALRFSLEEVATFFKQTVALDLTDDEVAALADRTEGWVAALQAAALSLSGRPDVGSFISTFNGSHRYIMDYLVDEVLQQQPEPIQTFLLQTSILERLSGSLGEAITGQEYGQATLEWLEAANLFIVPLDDERRWYRYHHLFADGLRHRLELTQPQNMPEYHRRASVWFEQQELAVEAIHHALAGHDFERAATLIESIALPLVMGGQQTTVGSWLAELPADLRLARPRLALAYAAVAVFNADFAAVEAYLSEAEAAVLSEDEDQVVALRIEVAALRAVASSVLGDRRAPELGRIVLAQLNADHPLRSTIVPALSYAAFAAGDLAAASQMLEEAIEAQPISRASSAVHAGLVATLGMVRRAQGRLQEARRLAMEVLDATTRDGRTLPVSGALLAYLLLGLTQYEQNELDAAERTLRQGAELARQYQVTMYELLARFYLGQVLGARGDLAGALRLVEQVEARAGRYLSPLNRRELVGYRVLLWLKQGDLAAASAWAAQNGRTTDPDRPQFTAYDIDRFALVRTLMAEGRWEAAQTAVAELLDAAETTGHGRFVIWALVWQALILHAQGNTSAALKSLERALVLAEPEGYVRIFVEEGAPIAELLEKIKAGEVGRTRSVKAYILKLLSFFPESIKPESIKAENGKTKTGETHPKIQPSFLTPVRSAGASVLQPLVEPLTERELEVLHLIAAGLNNRTMGEELVITVGTVKRHITNIYGKLGVNNRVQAVAKASELDLLPQEG